MVSHVQEECDTKGRKLFYRGERKWGGGAVTVTEFCYNHRVLPLGLSRLKKDVRVLPMGPPNSCHIPTYHQAMLILGIYPKYEKHIHKNIYGHFIHSSKNCK